MKNRQIIAVLLSMILIISLCLPNGSSVLAAEAYSEETAESVDYGSTEAAAEEEAIAEESEEEAGTEEGVEDSEEEGAPEVEAVLEEEVETDSDEETGDGSVSVEEETETVEEEIIEEETTSEEEKEPAAAAVEKEPAEEAEKDLADEDAVIIEEVEELEYQPKDTKSADDLFAGYVDMEFGIGEIVKPDSGKKRTTAGSKLKADTLLAYTRISGQLPLLAAGEITSTVFTISGEDLGFTKVRWSAEDLGVAAIVENGAFTQDAKDAAVARLKEEYFNLSLLIDALLSDHPYLLYWYDKTQTTRASGYRFSAVRVSGVYYLTFAGDLILQFPVAEAYSAGEYTVDASVGQIVQESVENAQDIVAENMHLPDYDKLVAYRQAICGLTSYNFAAIHNNESYGNPWQLIWVFDGDPATSVVCEGYSKAFKYLCDQSSFDSDIDCKAVTGLMNSGEHMWNVVTMEDERNYLVDVTNCDAGMVGADDQLFLIGTEGSPSDGYLFTIGNQNYILYTYDNDMPALWSTEELALSERNYIPISVENAVISGIEDKVYTGGEITQQVTVEYGGKVLTEEIDYTVSYEDNTNAGTARVIIHGIGMYTGNNVQEFTIEKAEQVISAENLALQPYESVTALVSGAQGTLTYETGDSSVATATNDGTVTAVAQGTTEVTVYAAATVNYEAAIAEFTVTVTAYDLSSEQCAAELAEASLVYDGSEKKPGVAFVEFGNVTLTENMDYTVSYENNINAGTGFLIVNGNNTTTTGSKTLAFMIAKADPALVVSQDHLTIIAGKSQTIQATGDTDAFSYSSSNENVATVDEYGKVTAVAEGTAVITVTVVETVNYNAASLTVEVEVVPMVDISAADIVADDLVYDGTVQKPLINAVYGDYVLTEGTDYEVSYGQNSDAGEYPAEITGIGDFKGSVTINYNIIQAEQDISAEDLTLKPYESAMAQVSGAQGTLTYASNALSVATVANDGTVTAVAQGNAEITIHADATANYKEATTTFTVTVTAYDLSSELCAAVLAESSFVYDNSEKKPEFTYVRFGDIPLTKDTDYTVSYENNLNAGTGVVTINGNNTTTTGSKTVEFTIEKADQVLSASSEKIVNGKMITVTTAGAQGDLTYAFANREIAQITNDDGAGKIKVKGTKVGTTMLTITAAETENYSEAVFELEIRVVPGASTHVEFTNVASGIKVSWNAVEGAKYYKVYRGTEHLFTTSKLCGADTAVKMRNSEKFTYKVVASTTKDSDAGDSTVCRTGTGYRLMTVGIVSLTNPTPGKMTVTYGKNAACDKYAVRYGLKEDMSDARLLSVQGADNLSKTVSVLQGKMYYVQVRCYKIVNGKNYYSGFCTTKKLTIKK